MQGMQGPIQQTGVPQLTYQGSSAAPSQHGTQPSSGEQHTGEVAHDAHVTPDDSKTVSQHQGNANLEQMGSSSQAKQNQPAEKTLSSMFKSALGAVQGGLSKFVATTGKAIMNAGHGVSDFARDIRNEIEAGDFIDNRKANLSYLADKASQKTGIGLDSKIQKQEAEVKGLEQKVASDTQSLKDLNDEKAQVTQQRDNAPNQTLKDAYNDKLGKLDKQIDQHETSLEGNSSKLEIAQTRLDELKNAHGASMLTSASRMAGNVKPLAEGLAGRIGFIEQKRPESSNDTKLSASKKALADLTKADNEIGRQLNDLKATLSKYPENPSNPEQAKMKTSIQNQIKTLMTQRIANTRSLETLGNDIKGMEGKQKTEDATFREQNPTLKDWASATAGRISTVASNMFSKISTSEGRQEIKEGIGNTLGDLKDAAGTKLGELKDAAGTKLGELKDAAGTKLGELKDAAKEKLGTGSKDSKGSGESEGVEKEGQQVAHEASTGESVQGLRGRANARPPSESARKGAMDRIMSAITKPLNAIRTLSTSKTEKAGEADTPKDTTPIDKRMRAELKNLGDKFVKGEPISDQEYSDLKAKIKEFEKEFKSSGDQLPAEVKEVVPSLLKNLSNLAVVCKAASKMDPNATTPPFEEFFKLNSELRANIKQANEGTPGAKLHMVIRDGQPVLVEKASSEERIQALAILGRAMTAKRAEIKKQFQEASPEERLNPKFQEKLFVGVEQMQNLCDKLQHGIPDEAGDIRSQMAFKANDITNLAGNESVRKGAQGYVDDPSISQNLTTLLSRLPIPEGKTQFYSFTLMKSIAANNFTAIHEGMGNFMESNKKYMAGESDTLLEPKPYMSQITFLKETALEVVASAMKGLDKEAFNQFKENGTLPEDPELRAKFEKYQEFRNNIGDEKKDANWAAVSSFLQEAVAWTAPKQAAQESAEQEGEEKHT